MSKLYIWIISFIIITTYSCLSNKKIVKQNISIKDSLIHIVKMDSSTKENLRHLIGNQDLEECKLTYKKLFEIENKIYYYLNNDTNWNDRRLLINFEEFERQYLIYYQGYTSYLYIKYTLGTNDKLPYIKQQIRKNILTVYAGSSFYQYVVLYPMYKEGKISIIGYQTN